ncbi:MAG: hypothetical protein O7A09_08150 [Proteobacteria bacterium]|nr:hypothetical protein [Pseudomonadota bacterium]
MSGDDRDDRPKRSWREIDQRRDRARTRDEPRPRGKAAEARAKTATAAYLKNLDQMFSGETGGEEGAGLAKAVRDAHGSSDLAAACRAYLDALGPPRDPALLALFLDAGQPELVVAGLEALLAARVEERLEVTSGLRSQLRVLEGDFNDEVAEAAEALLEAL